MKKKQSKKAEIVDLSTVREAKSRRRKVSTASHGAVDRFLEFIFNEAARKKPRGIVIDGRPLGSFVRLSSAMWTRDLFLTPTDARTAAATLRKANVELFGDVARNLDILARRAHDKSDDDER